MLFGINALTLIHTLTCHCYGRFANDKRPFICYSSVAPFIPLSSFFWMSEGIWKVLLGRIILFVPRDSRLIIFIMGQYLRQLIATFLPCVGRTCALSLCFPCIDFDSFFRKKKKKPFHILLLLHYTLSLKFETKRKLLHLLYGKTHFLLDSING